MDSRAKDLTYILIPKRSFNRYVLTYEVLFTQLCYSVDDKKTFNGADLASLTRQGDIDDKMVVLQLEHNSTGSFISISKIVSVYFLNQDALMDFKERSYNNFDVNTFNIDVLPENYSELSSKKEISLSKPEYIDKSEFTELYYFQDALVRLIYLDGVNGEVSVLNNPDIYINSEHLLRDILSKYTEKTHLDLAIVFFKVCSRYNIDYGWDPREIISSFNNLADPSIRKSSDFNLWVSIANKVISNDSVNLIFTDERNITLRAMTLVLLNPSLNSLEAMSKTMQSQMGQKVYKLASLFVSAREGYSFLIEAERNNLGTLRKNLQILAEKIYTPPPKKCKSESKVESILGDSDSSVKNNEVELHDNYRWINFESDSGAEKVYQIKGVKPLSGFDLKLVSLETKAIRWRIIDSEGPKGMDKFKGQFAINIILLQSKLPKGTRFEVCDNGLFLNIPPEWLFKSTLHEELNKILSLFIALRIAQKSSKIAGQ